MPKQVKQKRKNRTTDVNQIAHQLVERSTQETEPQEGQTTVRPSSLTEYLAAIGRKGGKISGKRRMVNLTPEKRREIALRAAQARWSKKRKKEKP